MYTYEAKKIIIHHANDAELFAMGKKYRLLPDSEIIRIEYEQHDNCYASTRIDIYIEYVIKNSVECPIHKIFFHVIGGDVLIESEKA